MNNKLRKIVGIDVDDTNLYIDVRVVIPLEVTSNELVEDLLTMKDDIIKDEHPIIEYFIDIKTCGNLKDTISLVKQLRKEHMTEYEIS